MTRRVSVPGRAEVGRSGAAVAWLEARSCLFAVGVFGLLAVCSVVPLPIARYDALRLTGYRPVLTAVAAAGVYLNFFTHHFLPDLRLLAAVRHRRPATVVVTRARDGTRGVDPNPNRTGGSTMASAPRS